MINIRIEGPGSPTTWRNALDMQNAREQGLIDRPRNSTKQSFRPVTVNTAVWYIDIDSEASFNGPVQNIDVDIDPLVWFAGVGHKF